MLRESDSSWYMREENGGLLLGPYEKGAPACYVDGPGDNSEYELFQEDLDRLMPHIETAIARVPAFGEVGVKKVYNGAIAYTPDGSPIVGPAWDVPNFWLNEGHSFGVTAAGGAGWQLAEWIVEGEPTIDMLGVDPRRFGPYASRGYLKEKNEEAYAAVFTVHYPDEERVAARPLKRAPSYDRFKELGAVFGTVYGFERPNWFAPPGYALSDADLARPDVLLNENHPPRKPGEKIREKWSFRRSNYFDFVGAECRNVHENVGVQDMSAFAKAIVAGPGAEAWLDSILANRIPKKIGRIGLCHLLSARGGVRAEFTVCRTGPESFYLVSAGALERHDHDVLRKLLPRDGGVRFQPITAQNGVLVIAGPNSRKLLEKVTDADLSTAAFPWLTAKKISIGPADTWALRVNFVGELGWELPSPDRDAEHDLRPALRGGQGIRRQAVRHSRHAGDGGGEILPAGRARAVDRVRRVRVGARPFRASQQRRIPRPRCAGRLAREGVRQPLRQHGDPRRHRRRCARLGAHPARRRDGRPLHAGRLRMADRQVARARHGAPRPRRDRPGVHRADTWAALPGYGDRRVAL